MKKVLVILVAACLFYLGWLLIDVYGVKAQDTLYGLPPHAVLFPKADGSSTGELRFLELYSNGENYVALKAPTSLSASIALKLPNSIGTTDQLLRSDGAGQMYWGPRESGQLTVYFKTTAEISQLPWFWINRDKNITITEVWCAIPSGVMEMNIQRDDGTPANVLASNLSCAVGGAGSSTFNSGENQIAAGMSLTLAYDTGTITAVAPINITVRYTVD